MGVERNIKLISVLNFFTDFIFFAPVAIIYFSKVTGSYALGMSIFSIAYISSAILEIPTGVVSDVVGRKLTTVFGAISSLICLILYALAGSYWTLVLGAVFQGASRAFYSGNNDALLFDTLKKMGKENEYHSYLGKSGSMFQIALATASLSGGFLASISYSLVMWISVLPQIGSVITSMLLVDPNPEKKESSNIYIHLKKSLKRFFDNYRLRLLSISSVVRFSLGETGFFLQSAFINTLWPTWAVGIAYTFSFLGGAVSYWFSGKIINRFDLIKTLNFATLFNRVVGITGLAIRNVYSPAIMSLSSLTFGFSNVSENSLMQKEFTDSERATLSSINSFIGNIAFGITSVVIGMFADKFGVVNALLVVQILLFIPLLVYHKIYR